MPWSRQSWAMVFSPTSACRRMWTICGSLNRLLRIESAPLPGRILPFPVVQFSGGRSAALKDLRFVAHREINLDLRVYNAYAGRYKISHDTVVTVTREGNRLMAEPTDDSKF